MRRKKKNRIENILESSIKNMNENSKLIETILLSLIKQKESMLPEDIKKIKEYKNILMELDKKNK